MNIILRLPLVVILFLAAMEISVERLSSQEPILLEVRGDASLDILADIRAAQLSDDGLYVLLGSAPVLHFSGPSEHSEWGRMGDGPAEFSSPADVEWSGDRLLVLDVQHHKIVSFSETGAFVASRSLRGTWANHLFLTPTDTVIGSFIPLGDKRAVLRLDGSNMDTIFAYETTSEDRVRLQADGAPSLTVRLPYTPTVVWTVLPDGDLAIWEPEHDEVSRLDRHTHNRTMIGGPGAPEATTPADVDLWIQDVIPEGFAGQLGVFDPLVAEARKVASESFPKVLPAVLELVADPVDGLWIRKTTRSAGQSWLLLRSNGQTAGTIRLPTGRTLLDIGPRGFLTKTRDELGIERIELYAMPDWR